MRHATTADVGADDHVRVGFDIDHALRALYDRTVSHYEVLGVGRDATASEIRSAYVTLARRHHPDRDGGDAAIMRSVNEAWATLRDPARRAAYDTVLLGTSASVAPREEVVILSEEEDLLADLADDTPIGRPVVLPVWLSLLPVAVFVFALGSFGVGMLFASTPALAIAVALMLLSLTFFLAAPFVALLNSRRPD